MLRSLVIVFSILALIGLGAGLLTWRAAQGEPAAALEARYAGPADRFLDIDGARVRLREEGPADAPAILMIHGFTYSLETWDAWAAALREDYRVIRYDLLGHGLTGPDPRERYAPQERAAFIGAVMDALDLPSAIIAGNSLGGLAAWRFAAASPDRAEALILISPGVYPYNGVSEAPAEIPAAMKAYLLTAPEAGVRASAALVFHDEAALSEDRLALLRDMIRREGNGEAMIRSLEEFTLPDPAPLLAKIIAPTLVLWGEEDVIIPVEQGRRLENDIAGARLIVYPGVGHAAQEEAPALTLRDVTAFLASLNARETDPS